jgi:hypothetical protein
VPCPVLFSTPLPPPFAISLAGAGGEQTGCCDRVVSLQDAWSWILRKIALDATKPWKDQSSALRLGLNEWAGEGEGSKWSLVLCCLCLCCFLDAA